MDEIARDLHRWRELATHPAIEAFFVDARRRLADVVRAERPICLASGACCHFERFGHRMYLSGLEAAFVVHRIESARAARRANPLRILDVDAARARGDCPYLARGPLGDRCGEHEERPLGCRIYFCDRGPDGRGADWQSALYEEIHREIIALHGRLDAPYRYLEWREALAMLAGQDGPGDGMPRELA